MPGVIRRETHATLRSLSLIDVERQASAAVERARSDAAELLSHARQGADQILEQRRSEAYAIGLAEGRKAGEASARRDAEKTALLEAQDRLTNLASTLQTALDAFNRGKARLLAEAETGLIELALAIARRVCKAQAAGDANVARANAVHLLEMVRHASDLELRVSPAEYETLRHAAQDFLTTADRHEHVAVIADAAISAGDCILRSREGEINASLDTQLDAIAAALVPVARTDETAEVAEVRREE